MPAFIWACEHGFQNLVSLMLRTCKVNAGAQSNAALVRACHNGHHKVVARLLKETSVDPTATDNLEFVDQLLVNAITKSRVQVVRLLLEDDRMVPTYPLLNMAILTSPNNTAIVKLLLIDRRVDPSAQNNNAIVRACSNTSIHRLIQIIELLLSDDRVDPSAQVRTRASFSAYLCECVCVYV